MRALRTLGILLFTLAGMTSPSTAHPGSDTTAYYNMRVSVFDYFYKCGPGPFNFCAHTHEEIQQCGGYEVDCSGHRQPFVNPGWVGPCDDSAPNYAYTTYVSGGSCQ